MKGLKAALAVGGIGIIGYAIWRYYQAQIAFLKDITYQIVGMKFVSISQEAITIDITSRVFNSSNVEVTITEMYLDFYLNGITVGNVTEGKELVIMPQRSTDATIRLTFSPKLILSNIVSLITLSVAAKDMSYTAKGYVKMKSSFIRATLPFDYQGTVKELLKS